MTLGSWIGDLREGMRHPECAMSEWSSSKICFILWILRQGTEFLLIEALTCLPSREPRARLPPSFSCCALHIHVVLKVGECSQEPVFRFSHVYPSVLLIVSQVRLFNIHTVAQNSNYRYRKLTKIQEINKNIIIKRFMAAACAIQQV